MKSTEKKKKKKYDTHNSYNYVGSSITTNRDCPRLENKTNDRKYNIFLQTYSPFEWKLESRVIFFFFCRKQLHGFFIENNRKRNNSYLVYLLCLFDGTEAKRQSTTTKQVVLQRLKYFCKKKKTYQKSILNTIFRKFFLRNTILSL